MTPRTVLLLAACTGWCIAADASPAPGTPPPGGSQEVPDPRLGAPASPRSVDSVTAHRAEAAADAYLKAQAEHDAKPQPEAEDALASAEVELLEAQTFLDQHQPLKAGDLFLQASKHLAAITPDQRLALGTRLHKASASLTALSRRLLDEQAFNLGTPDPASPADAH
jgi:hypothetical protein